MSPSNVHADSACGQTVHADRQLGECEAGHRQEIHIPLSIFFQTEHKMSIEEVCRKFQTDIVQVRI